MTLDNIYIAFNKEFKDFSLDNLKNPIRSHNLLSSHDGALEHSIEWNHNVQGPVRVLEDLVTAKGKKESAVLGVNEINRTSTKINLLPLLEAILVNILNFLIVIHDQLS